MLKPSATKSLAQSSTDDLIAAFKAKGGVIQHVETGVANGLSKKKFMRKPPTPIVD